MSELTKFINKYVNERNSVGAKDVFELTILKCDTCDKETCAFYKSVMRYDWDIDLFDLSYEPHEPQFGFEVCEKLLKENVNEKLKANILALKILGRVITDKVTIDQC